MAYFTVIADTGSGNQTYDFATFSEVRGLTHNNTDLLYCKIITNSGAPAVTDTSLLFFECSAMVGVDLSEFDTSQVTDMSYVFAYCGNLQTANLEINTSNVTDAIGMFYECKSLQTLDLRTWDTGKIADMRNMFSVCTQLTTIYASECWSTASVTQGSDVFSGCTALVGAVEFDMEHTGHDYANYVTGYLTYKSIVPPYVPPSLSTYPIIRMTLAGEEVEFRDEEVIEATVLQEMHPVSIELPISTADVTVYTSDDRFSIYSDGVFYNSLSRNLPIDIYESVSGSEQYIGKFYLDKWRAPTENTLRFELVDAIGVCENIEYPGSLWKEITPMHVVMADVMKDTNIPYTTDILVRSRPVRGWIPPGSVREALHQLCFATRSAIRTDHSMYIMVSDAALPNQLQAPMYPRITDEDKTGQQSVTHLPLVTDITLISHDYYTLGAVNQVVEEIYSAYLEPGTYVISYPKPYWKVWAEGVGSVPIYITTEDGRVITTEGSGSTWGTAVIASELETFFYHSNSISIQVLEAGTITVWGYPWLTSERTHSYSAGVSQVEQNAISVDSAMLVNSAIALGVLNKVVEYYQLRYRKEATLFPRHIVLHSVNRIDSLRGKQLLGITERLRSNLTGGFLIDAAFTGMEREEAE